MNSEEFRELLERASRGDREAYGPISEELRLKSRRFKYFPDPAFDGDYLRQKTLLKLFLKCEKEGAEWVDKEGKPVKNKVSYFWGMYKLTYWEIRKGGSKRQSRKQQDEEEMSSPFWPEPRPRLEGIADPNSDPAAFVEVEELWDLIWEEYNPSNPRLKEAALLCYGWGLSLAEIAEIMGAKLNTVKSWLHRWRKGLEEFLKLRGYGRYFRF